MSRTFKTWRDPYDGVSENPNGSASGPIQNIIRIKCN